MTYQHFELICGLPTLEEAVRPVERLSLSDALEEVFSADSGLLVMQWNGIFVPLSYKYDVSWILRDVVEMLEHILGLGQAESFDVLFPSNGFHAEWRITLEGSDLVVEPVWHQVTGSLLELLRDRSPLKYDRDQFVAEWSGLLSVVLRSLDNVGFASEHVYDYDRLVTVLDRSRRAESEG